MVTSAKVERGEAMLREFCYFKWGRGDVRKGLTDFM